MAVLMLVCFYILSREAAEATEKLKDVSGNIQAGQVILVDAGHGGIDSGMVGIEGLKEKEIKSSYLSADHHVFPVSDPGYGRKCWNPVPGCNHPCTDG